MTTISSTSFSLAEIRQRIRDLKPDVADQSQGYSRTPMKMTPELKAQAARNEAAKAAADAAYSRHQAEAKRISSVEYNESHVAYLTNVATLSLEGAKKSLELAGSLEPNLIIRSAYGDKKITDLKMWTTALKDHISKKEAELAQGPKPVIEVSASTKPSVQTDAATATVSPQANSAAASTYRQMQNMVNKTDASS